MNKEDLILFLKDNLKVQVSTNKDGGGYGDRTYVEVKVSIMLDDEVITKSTDSFSID
jgi:hypothetical protein